MANNGPAGYREFLCDGPNTQGDIDALVDLRTRYPENPEDRNNPANLAILAYRKANPANNVIVTVLGEDGFGQPASCPRFNPDAPVDRRCGTYWPVGNIDPLLWSKMEGARGDNSHVLHINGHNFGLEGTYRPCTVAEQIRKAIALTAGRDIGNSTPDPTNPAAGKVCPETPKAPEAPETPVKPETTIQPEAPKTPKEPVSPEAEEPEAPETD